MPDNQGAAGVRLELIDRSEFTVPVTPLTVAGVIGYSTKGPFNTIVPLNNISDVDNILGVSGFQNSKYNQGLLTARAALLGGAGVDYIRILSETEDPANGRGALKTDAWLVTYDTATDSDDTLEASFHAATNNVAGKNALDLSGTDLGVAHVDRFAPYGSRDIFGISKVVSTKQTKNYELDSGFVGDKLALFSIMAIDPSSTVRGASGAVDNLVVKTATNGTWFANGTFTVEVDDTTQPVANSTLTIYQSTFKFNAVDPDDGDIFVEIGGTVEETAENLKAAIDANLEGLVSSYYLDTDKLKIVVEYFGFDYGAIEASTSPASSLTVSTIDSNVKYSGSIEIIDDVADGDTITVFDSVYEFDNDDLIVSGNVKIAIPTVIPTKLEVAELIVKALEANGSKLTNIFYDVSDNGVLITYDYVGIDDDTSVALTVATSAASTFTVTALVPATTQPVYEYSDVIMDTEFGVIFEGLGIAKELVFRDSNNILVKKYQLTSDGDVIARSYISVSLTFGGQRRQFSGTLVPMVAGDVNLYIIDQTLQYANEFAFVINENVVYEDSFEEGIIDLGDSKVGGFPTSGIISYANDTHASDNDEDFTSGDYDTFIWSYDPRNNSSSTGFVSAWQMFLDKDTSDAFVLAAAGTNIQNLFARGREVLDMNVVTSMLDVCDKRKDCIAIFDTVDEKDVDEVIRKSEGVAGLSNEMARWGAIYDGRSLMDDTFYTKLTIQTLKTVGVINRIVSNTRGGLWWIPPAGFTNGQLNGAFAKAQKTPRTYNYASDPDSDIAKLYDSKINPTRVTQGGQFLYGQKTLQSKSSALQRLNVAMLIAGMNKRFEKYLDRNIFLLNTRELREQITANIQAQLDSIATASPAGITSGRVVCDTSNNTPSVIQQRRLIVDIVDLRATEAAEFITLRTTIERSGEDTLSIDTQIL